MRGDIGGVGTGGQTGGVHGHNEGSAGVHHVYKLGMRDPALGAGQGELKVEALLFLGGVFMVRHVC